MVRWLVIAALTAVPAGAQLRELPLRGRSGHQVTFSNQVVRIFQQHCQVCHRDGGVAPFALTSYPEAQGKAGAISRAIADGFMPPWRPVAGIGEFRGDRRLDDVDKQVLLRWVASGASEGDPSTLPLPAVFPEGWRLGEPDLVIEIPGYAPAPDDGDDYRCFSLDPDILARKQIRAIEVLPGNLRIVHHVLLFPDPAGVSATLATPGDPQPGYSCFGDAGFDSVQIYGGWVPGASPIELPPGVIFRLEPGMRIAVQVHYEPDGSLQSDQTKVGLHFGDEASPKDLFTFPLLNDEFVIPPGAKDHEVTASITVPLGVSGTLYTIAPHMHLLGRRIKVDLIRRTGAVEPLIYIDDWDFNWQDFYWLKEPLRFQPLDRLLLTAHFDNSADNPRNQNNPPKPVGWGPKTTDEMALAFLGVVID